jgi:cytochrome c oxidase subunit 4
MASHATDSHGSLHGKHHGAHQDHDHPLVGHLVPLSTLVFTGVVLLLLTVITVAVRYIDLGEMNIFVAVGVAAVKAILVGLFFMHLWWDRPFNSLTLICSVVFVALLMVFVMMDSKQYEPRIIPGNPKTVQETLNAQAPEAPIAKQLAQ